MAKSRRMVSVKAETHKKAKQLRDQYASMGLHLSLEDAVAMVKVRDDDLPPIFKQPKKPDQSDLGGFFL